MVVVLLGVQSCAMSWVDIQPWDNWNKYTGQYYVGISSGRLEDESCKVPPSPISMCWGDVAEEDRARARYCQQQRLTSFKGEATPCAMKIIREELKKESLCKDGFRFVKPHA
ncbi:MAG: hypothetical protein ACREVE_15610 [Gammaproteobacteria bacterium]